MGPLARRFWPTLLAPVLCAAPGRAEETSLLDLRWEAPEGCPQAPAIRARVRELAGAGVERPLSARGVIVRTPARYELTLVIRDGANESERVLESDSCADLGGAAAVALSLLMRGSSVSGPGGSGSDASAGNGGGTSTSSRSASDAAARDGARARDEKSATVAQSRADERASRDAQDPAEPDDSRLRFGLFAPLGTVELGPLPEPSLGVAAGAGLHLGRFSLVALGQLTREQTFDSEDFPGFGGTVSRRAAALSVCRGFRTAAFEVAPCISLWLEHLRATGSGTDLVPRTKRIAWLSPGFGAIGHYHAWEWLAVVVSLGGRVEGSRPSFSVSGLGEVERVAPAAFLLAAGTEWIF